MVVFVQFEIGQAVVPVPGRIAQQVGPVVIVAGLAAHVNHAVDAAAAAQGFAARVNQAAAIEACLRLGGETPVGARVANAVQVAHRDVDPVVIVLRAGFDQQHALAGIGAEPVGQQATGRTRTHDDVVEGAIAHSPPGL